MNCRYLPREQRREGLRTDPSARIRQRPTPTIGTEDQDRGGRLSIGTSVLMSGLVGEHRGGDAVVELPSRLRSGRNVGAELQRSRLFTRQAPRATAATTVASGMAPFVVISWMLSSLYRSQVPPADARSRRASAEQALHDGKRQSNSSDDDGECGCTLHSISPMLSWPCRLLLAAGSSRQAWRPVSTAPALHSGTRPERQPQRLLTERSPLHTLHGIVS